MKKIMLMLGLVVSLLLFVQVCTYGENLNNETPGIHGEVSCKYELLDYNPGQEWTVDVHYRFNGWLSVGALQITYTDGFNEIGFVPYNQLYDFYVKLEYKKISIQIGQWCNHPVIDILSKYANLNYTDIPKIKSGIYLYGKYKF
jgi:hypothetical protein